MYVRKHHILLLNSYLDPPPPFRNPVSAPVSLQPIKMTGSWVYKTGSWKDATQYYTDILMNKWQK